MQCKGERMKTFLQAIATVEGFYKVGNRPQRNNNPGDLIWIAESSAFGATHGDVLHPDGYMGYKGFAVFPDAITGWKALQRWLSVPAKFDKTGKLVGGYLGATLSQVINRFAPPVENDTARYVSNVCNATGLSADVVITAELLQTPEAA